MNTSATSAAAWPASAIWRSPLNCMPARATPRQYTSIPDLMTNIVAKVPDTQVMADLDACAAWAAKNGGDPARLGITGFCWGGRIVWLYSAHNPQLKAGVAWYGRLVSATHAGDAEASLDLAGALQAPVLGLYGGADQGIPLDTIEKMRDALAKGPAAARESEIRVITTACRTPSTPTTDRATAGSGRGRLAADAGVVQATRVAGRWARRHAMSRSARLTPRGRGTSAPDTHPARPANLRGRCPIA